jgi:4-amino-4-deoxy-L-arabinose transferase-like glycosyltransferase
MLAAGHASYVLGQISGALLLAIFAAALTLAMRPMIRERDWRFAIALAIAIAVTAIKLALLRNLPGVTVDLAQFELWGQTMLQLGPAHIYDPQFNCKYTPAYLYPLWAAAATSPD